MTTVYRSDFEMETIYNDCPDTSYLEQDEFSDRLAEYRAGAFYFIGIRATVKIEVPVGNGVATRQISSPGLWGIESDSGDDYFKDVFSDECYELQRMLQDEGITVED